MINNRFALLALALAGGLAAAFAKGRRSRRPLEKWQLEEGLRTWEDEGGNLARPDTSQVARPVARP